MNNNDLLTIVAYHYVRKLEGSRYPEIKGLSIDNFVNQIQYIKRNYYVISANQLISAIDYGESLPPKSLVLTFDDGYADHFQNVYPILQAEGLSACFFPPVKCITQALVLDVNKIHFILAKVNDAKSLVKEIFQNVVDYQSEYELFPPEFYWRKFGSHGRFDSPEVVFIKKMLQRELPTKLRTIVINKLFEKYITTDEAAFSEELYMSTAQLQLMVQNGMYVGSHGYEHVWLDTLSKEDQEREIDASLSFLSQLGSDTNRWIMCYPYGAYNDCLCEVLSSRQCVAALTTKKGLIPCEELSKNSLILPRIDTNDLQAEVAGKC